MTLGWKLFAVFLAFVAILTVVIVVAIRENRRTRRIAAGDFSAQQDQDARVMAIIFFAIAGGMLLTLLTGWLVFF